MVADATDDHGHGQSGQDTAGTDREEQGAGFLGISKQAVGLQWNHRHQDAAGKGLDKEQSGQG